MYLKIGWWAIYRYMTQGCAIHKMTSEHAHLKKKTCYNQLCNTEYLISINKCLRQHKLTRIYIISYFRIKKKRPLSRPPNIYDKMPTALRNEICMVTNYSISFIILYIHILRVSMFVAILKYFLYLEIISSENHSVMFNYK